MKGIKTESDPATKNKTFLWKRSAYIRMHYKNQFTFEQTVSGSFFPVTIVRY